MFLGANVLSKCSSQSSGQSSTRCGQVKHLLEQSEHYPYCCRNIPASARDVHSADAAEIWQNQTRTPKETSDLGVPGRHKHVAEQANYF